ncbi:MAG: EAL domain-containing protein [Solirubrobacterales bacterium]
MTPSTTALNDREERLRRRLERERSARREAEQISEGATRALFERQQELALLEGIATAANEATNLNDVMQLTIRRVCEHTGFPIGHAYLRAPSGEEVEPTAIWQVDDPDRIQPFRRATEAVSLALGKGLPGRVLESGRPAWIEDVTEDSNFPRASVARAVGLRAAFALPILVGSQAEGVLEFFTYRAMKLDAGVLHLMNQIGTQLGRLIERTRAQERIAHQATHDALTGLPNRVLFQDRLSHALTRRRRAKTSIAVCFIDLDRFKSVNDTFGHGVGDELLGQAAERLRSVLRPADTIARLGGDEFVILCEELSGEQEAVRLAERLQRVFGDPFTLGGSEHIVNASIGVAIGGGKADADALMRDADSAMYRAKEQGRGRYELCDDEMRERALRRAQTEQALSRALERDELELHFQPIVALNSGKIRAVEALLRWHHPEHGLIDPGEFIPIAEESGQIIPIGAWVLREACRQAVSWRAHLGAKAPTPIAVNLSARQLAIPELAEVIEQILVETGCAPSDLALELTESAAVSCGTLPSATLAKLRALGVRVLLDDFGTGYSSLNHIRQLPIDTIKIDGSFIRGLRTEQEAKVIVRAIVGMATALGLDVVAEGAESEEQALLASELGCELAQGYHFAHPMPAAELEALVNRELKSGPHRDTAQ